jgi:hypothetical protein
MKPQITIQTLKDYREELAAVFPMRETLAYPEISKTQLSLLRFGGGNICGGRYCYQPADDSLIRADVVKWLQNRIAEKEKAAKLARKAAGEAKQGVLL